MSQDKLTIKNLDFNDAGLYKCDVSIVASGTLESYPIDYDVVRKSFMKLKNRCLDHVINFLIKIEVHDTLIL